MRPYSMVAHGWWDYTTLEPEILDEAARLTVQDMEQLGRDGFHIVMHDTLEDFYLAEALEYIESWTRSTNTAPTGLCGPIGPTEQLPLVARVINDLGISVRDGHFWAMDEWYQDGKEVSTDHPLSFARANLDLCFDRIRPELRMPDENLHFLKADNIKEYTKSFDQVRCLVMQGGQGDVKHWAFNDPFRREGAYVDQPPSPDQYRKLSARIVDLHPVTMMQNARTSGGGVITGVPSQALTVGPVETWKAERVSIWHAGNHDNAFGMRLTTYMLSKGLKDSSVPMSILSDHTDVTFHFYRPSIGDCAMEMH